MQASDLHHLAIATPDPERLGLFYRDLLGLIEIRRFHDANGLRSIWLNMGQAEKKGDAGILMLERCDNPLSESAASEGAPGKELPSSVMGSREDQLQGFHLLAFRIDQSDAQRWRERIQASTAIIEKESEFTLYFRDPDGNRLGLSWYEGTAL